VLVSLTDADVPSFGSRLEASLSDWRREGLNSAMMRVPIKQAALVAVAAEHGFVYHHAEGSQAILKCWLKPERPDKVPPFASHRTLPTRVSASLPVCPPARLPAYAAASARRARGATCARH
jgi:hypothetical protein